MSLRCWTDTDHEGPSGKGPAGEFARRCDRGYAGTGVVAQPPISNWARRPPHRAHCRCSNRETYNVCATKAVTPARINPRRTSMVRPVGMIAPTTQAS